MTLYRIGHLLEALVVLVGGGGSGGGDRRGDLGQEEDICNWRLLLGVEVRRLSGEVITPEGCNYSALLLIVGLA